MTFRLRDMKDNDFKWVPVAVYGAAQPKFLTELVQSCRDEKLPLCIGGTSILSGIIQKRTMIDLMGDDPSCSM